MQESKKLFSYRKNPGIKLPDSKLLGMLVFLGILFLPGVSVAFDNNAYNDTIPIQRRGAGTPEISDTLPVQPVPSEIPEREIREAQPDQESVRIRDREPEKLEIVEEKHFSLKATMFSAALPGLGQAYNGSYWKIPVIYAGFGAVAYSVWINNNEYQTFRRAYLARLDGNPNIVDNFPDFSTDQLQRAANHYKRNIEITYIFGAGLYVFNILDASGIVKLPPLKLPTLKQPGEPHNPMKATMLSATLPGLGQAYNGRYWKIPIIYAGFGAVAWFVGFNNTEYQSFRRAYVARVDGNPNTVDELTQYSTDQLQRATNFYRRNLEITYILGAALYVLNILDATVDAHLIDFDVGEDLSMKLHPVVFPDVNPTNAGRNTFAGLRFTFRF